MNVEMSIRVPITGLVSAINVSKGDSVDPDDVLICLSVVDDDDDEEQYSTVAKKAEMW